MVSNQALEISDDEASVSVLAKARSNANDPSKIHKPFWLVDEFNKLVPVDSGDVLDLGCGLAPYGKSFSGRYLGVDFSEESLTVARQNNPDLEFRMADITDLTSLNSKFDKIWCSMVLHRIRLDKIHNAIANCKGVLRLGGAMMIIMHTEGTVRGIAREYLEGEYGFYTKWHHEDFLSILRENFNRVDVVANDNIPVSIYTVYN